MNQVGKQVFNNWSGLNLDYRKSSYNGEVYNLLHGIDNKNCLDGSTGQNLFAPHWNSIYPFQPKGFRKGGYYLLEKDGAGDGITKSIRKWLPKKEIQEMLAPNEITNDNIKKYSLHSYDEMQEVDITKEHMTILWKAREDNFPQYTIFDDIVPFSGFKERLPVGRYYYVGKIQIPFTKRFVPTPAWIDSNSLNFYIKNGFAFPEYIVLELRPKYEIELQLIRDVITFMYEDCKIPDKSMKKLVNNRIGAWGAHKGENTQGFLSISDDSASRVQDYVHYHPLCLDGDLKWHYKVNRYTIHENHRPIYQAIIDDEWMMLFQTLLQICTPRSRVCYVKTDAVGLVGGNLKEVKQTEDAKPGDLRFSDVSIGK
jgi:hypothetical protein